MTLGMYFGMRLNMKMPRMVHSTGRDTNWLMELRKVVMPPCVHNERSDDDRDAACDGAVDLADLDTLGVRSLRIDGQSGTGRG